MLADAGASFRLLAGERYGEFRPPLRALLESRPEISVGEFLFAAMQRDVFRADLATLMDEAQEQVRELLRQRHRLQAAQEDDFNMRVLAEMFAAQEESARIMSNLLAAIASVSLLVGGIGIMNIMLVSVTERTREIGLRMAVGARSRDILTQFLVEAVTLAGVGGVAGVALGLVASETIATLAEWSIEVSPQAVALAFLFAGVVGVFFGFYPARKASRLDPIEALRYE